ncbi:DUF2637 domain-containing protein [Streptomyces sp. DSM 44915]|uniref:DUF2637 domain-containing protein n=1 Tax=Streptomyces chisholmiae TaxID=3075540 RepID=A0ABU2JM12_9ACTN|nr:DUF2637 domain-containing protein [Streptomyces sp. DSM 44915]MDT0265564.1 DUF2637 domain-containing protein [Streptomyces sp. DSM 44915]
MTTKPLSRGERWLLGATSAGAVAVGGLGLASSFEAVSAAAARWGFDAPWMLPAGIDLAIPVFTVAHLLLVRMNMALAWVRAVPWALTGVTCWLNVAAGDTLPARVAHGVMPLLWVVLSEIGAHAYAVRIGAATGTRMERVRRSRWLLAPFATLALWRRMVLWETTSYREALARERQRQLVRAELRERYGRAWRRRAPLRTRVLLRLGELTPDGPAAGQDDPADPEPPAGKPSRSPAELLAQAREMTRDWPNEQLTAQAIRKAVRTSQRNGRLLRDALRAERQASLPAPA